MQPAVWTDRFQIKHKLAAGNFGVVYLAHDRQRGTDVALKVLREATAADLYRFKREFRGLADILHPNLVSLHELHHTGDQWFFTMEYVPGESFLDWVRPRRDGASGSVDEPSPRALPPRSPSVDEPTRTVQLPVQPARGVDRLDVDLERLEDSLYQLVDGVYALHLTGRLHRDLKPSNVRVTPEGRVVLLDFGLASDVRRLGAEHTHDAAVVGTPGYMSPEQAEDESLGSASDWYSVGVMLFEALTGRRPFEGPAMQVLQRKRVEVAPAPRDFVADTPAHLDELCRKLLARDPAARPDGKQVLEVLGRAPSAATLQLATSATPRFVGRRTELDALSRAFRDTREARPVAVVVRGSSGMGKSALVRQFLDETAIPSGAIVLEGRCYERESVPYKGLDSIIDALTNYLLHQPPARLEQLLPRDIQALARLFPVLRRVPAITEPTQIWLAPPDPHELRRRAFSGLRWLMHQLAQEVPMVVYIDDVQWGDADAASFLADLVLHPEPPAMLLVASCRLEEEEGSLLIQALRQRRPAGNGEVREMTLSAFTSREADELVASVRGSDSAGSDIDALMRESAGNPLFLSELARARGDREGSASLDDLLAARVEQLSDEARRLFEVCAVAGRPMPVDVALHAAGLSGEGGALAALQHERLLRVRSRDVRLVEPYHDRVRESAVARITAEQLRDVHRRLAESFEAAVHPDAESLTMHWQGAGEQNRAARWALVAAQAAIDTYAFNRAMTLYRLGLTSTELSPSGRHATKVRLAHALANAGRVVDAAAAFGDAATEAEGDEQVELRRLQLEQVLGQGQLTEGRELAREVLRSVGISMPSSHRWALVDVVVNRLVLRVRGLGFKERAASEIPAQLLQRLDVLWSVSSAVGLIDPILGRALQSRYIRQALAVGEPERVAKAISLEIGYRSLVGEPGWAACEALRERGEAIAERAGVPHLARHLLTTSGLAAFLSGRFDVANERLVEGARALRDLTVGHRFQIDLAEMFRVSALLYLGRIRELSRLMAILVREAEESGDAYAMRGLCSWRGNMVWLLQDQPGIAQRNLDAVATPRGPKEGLNLHLYYEMVSRTLIELYTGDVSAAAARMQEEWKLLEKSLLLRLQSIRIEAQHLRGRVALACAAQHPPDSSERREHCAVARAMAKRIDKEAVPWGHALAALLRAGVANLSGDRAAALEHLRTSVDGFAGAHMALYATVARRCVGRLADDDAGRAMITEAGAWMTEEGIRAPDSVCALLAPGCTPS